MTGHANGLQVVILIRSAFKLWNDVIDLCAELLACAIIHNSLSQTDLTQTGIALQYPDARLAPLSSVPALVSRAARRVSECT